MALGLRFDHIAGPVLVTFMHSGPGPSCFWEVKLYFQYRGGLNQDRVRFANNRGSGEICLVNEESFELPIRDPYVYFYRNEDP